jgi:hypothetical protein
VLNDPWNRVASFSLAWWLSLDVAARSQQCNDDAKQA